MPNPNEKSNPARPAEDLMRKILNQRLGGDNGEIINEVRALREEIRQLHLALLPPKSVIITGPDIERLYTALRKD
jgi:hypothetical protein